MSVFLTISESKLQNFKVLESSKGASTSSKIQIGLGFAIKTAKISDNAVSVCSPPESKEIVENDNVIYEVSPNNEEVKQVKQVEEVKQEVKPEILRKKIQPNPNMQSYHFHRIESAIPLVPEENNDDKLDYSPVKQQINKLKDVTGIEANLTKSQRGFDDLSVRDTELKDLIPTQNLLNVQEPKCTANKPEECECKSIKQGGNNYSIETESVILPYNGNPLYNIENL